MTRRSLGVIDIGSNAIRLLLVEPLVGGSYRVLDDQREPVRLASGLTKEGKISRISMSRAMESLQRMAAMARGRKARRLTVVATSAIRNALNRQEFVDRVRREIGLRVRVISGMEEARLAFESAARNFDLSAQRCAVVDVGGGSTELILSVKNIVRNVHTLPLGAVSLSERFIHSDPIRSKEFEKLSKTIRRELKNSDIDLTIPPEFIVASGGTANALAQIAMARIGLGGRPVQGFEMKQSDVRHILDALLRRTLHERKKMAGLSPERADIIVGGVTVLFELMIFLNVNTMRVNSVGIRHALLNRMIGRMSGNAKASFTGRRRVEIIESFGQSMGFEQRHASKVRSISLNLFDQFMEPFDLDPQQRDLLEAAALLHDIGDVVGYKSHHKHSYHLIGHAPLEGFTPSERELIAQVARYHRGSLPRKKHAPWKRLSMDERGTVSKLAGILRIADALDCRHSQGLGKIRCRVSDRRVRIILISDRSVDIEMHAAAKKADLFEKAFGRKIQFVPMITAASNMQRQVA